MNRIARWKKVEEIKAQAAIAEVLKAVPLLGVTVETTVEETSLKEIVIGAQGDYVRITQEYSSLYVHIPQREKKTIYEVAATIFSGDEELITVTKTFCERHEASIYQGKLEAAVAGVHITVEEKEVEVKEKEDSDE